jgi:hypothetical protein
MVALKVQTIGRDDPKERLQWGETYRRRSHTGKAWTLASLQVAFILRGHAIAPSSNRLTKTYGVRRKLKNRVVSKLIGRHGRR